MVLQKTIYFSCVVPDSSGGGFDNVKPPFQCGSESF
jgi:hypothetical protein